MWFLKLPEKEKLEWYENKMLPGLKNRINNQLDTDIKEILLPNGKDLFLRALLIKTPKFHYFLNKILMSRIIPDYNENEFISYLNVKSKSVHLTEQDEFLKHKYEKLKILLDVFDYEHQISKNKSRSYKLAAHKSVNVCPYCGRQYIFTVLKKDTNGKNDTERIARPEFDHWFSKELFPLLSLNWYNLIPSCHICNSGAKGNAIFSLATHLHPYISEPNCNFNFASVRKPNGSYGIQVINVSNTKVTHMLKDFSIEDIYNFHGELEVKDILQLEKKYKIQQVKGILCSLSKLAPNLREDDIYKMIFSTELKEARDLNRPLSKLKRDILTEIGIITDGHWK